ncbi:hypothetical protein RM844_20985 [Streptomyces sp. DSM 44915]|uniref:Uncharacterized protein n=1 Tax=Streptomyces chisholmiae TaxID=3075540 RepID=A0ABU2JUW0_9ACTN|nr:hypothetical protein [Streptomyces sp. DSM 44915]MDT0268766.1 hypothetical protein [Streptomyces sp. DSM 44915]
MATYLAFFDGSTTPWRLDAAEVTTALAGSWGAVDAAPIRFAERPAVRWVVPTDDGPGEVVLPENGTGLYFDASLPDSARLAALLRRLVPDAVELVFCDQGYYFDVRVQPGTTAAELLAEVDAQP